jgi:hypothetical protein
VRTHRLRHVRHVISIILRLARRTSSKHHIVASPKVRTASSSSAACPPFVFPGLMFAPPRTMPRDGYHGICNHMQITVEIGAS